MKKIALLLCLMTVALQVQAANETYLFRQRLNWVKFEKANPKEAPVGQLTHPLEINADQVEAMLLSIQISKKFLLGKDITSTEVFNSFEARRLASAIAEGLSRLTPEQVLYFSVVHKRPQFILRNDRLSMGLIYVSSDGVHVKFDKIFAKLDGDYESSASMDKMVRKAKTMRVALEAGQGQKLSYNGPTEIILDPAYPFSASVAAANAAELQREDEVLKGKAKKTGAKEVVPVVAPAPVPAPVVTNASGKTAAERLSELKKLKDQNLITPQEYETKRKQILSEI